VKVLDFGFAAIECWRGNPAESLLALIAHQEAAFVVNCDTDPRTKLVFGDGEEVFDFESGQRMECVARCGRDAGGHPGVLLLNSCCGWVGGGICGDWTGGASGTPRTPGSAGSCRANGTGGDARCNGCGLTEPTVLVSFGGK